MMLLTKLLAERILQLALTNFYKRYLVLYVLYLVI